MITAPQLPVGLPAAAVVDLGAVRHNVSVLRAFAGAAGVMAVVKADAYGHGLLPCARAALEGGAQWLGVAQVTEALALRAAGIDAPLLSWLTVPGDRYGEAVEAHVDLGISTTWALAEVAAAARERGVTARVHLKIDTGMNRNGSGPHDWSDLVDAALKEVAEGAVDLVGAFSHFACAEDPTHPAMRAQTEAFARALELAQRRGARFAVRHLANSAATLTGAGAGYDLVRTGLAVYGLSPAPQIGDPEHFGLRPAMSLLARVAKVARTDAGEGVSYGHTYTTPRDTTLALVPVGYADGLPCHASNTGPVMLGGRRHQVAGRICMDQIVLDLGVTRSDVAAGDVAVLFGDPGRVPGAPTAQEWAAAAGTIVYEIVARIGPRLPRLYVDTSSRVDAGSRLDAESGMHTVQAPEAG